MSLRASSVLVFSLAILIASAICDNEENGKDYPRNIAKKDVRNEFLTDAKEIRRSHNKRKNIRYANKKQREKKTKKKVNRKEDQNYFEYTNNTEIYSFISTQAKDQQQGCRCGVANLPPGRVIGGDKINPPRKYPWLVLVKYKHRGREGTCSGSLISSGHVLTAGHCVHFGGKYLPSKNVRVYIGDHNIKKKDDDLPEETSIMKVKIIKHPKYKGTNKKIDYDIALLKLEKQLDLDNFQQVRPICLPEDSSSKYFDIEAIYAGWGRTKYLASNIPKIPYEITLKTTNEKCRGYRKKKVQHSVTKTQICTDVLWYKKTPNSGDSGGPLIVEEEGKYTQIGIVSGGRSRTNKVGGKGIAVFTSVTKLLKWVVSKIKDDNRCL